MVVWSVCVSIVSQCTSIWVLLLLLRVRSVVRKSTYHAYLVPQLTREDSSSGSLDDVVRYRSDTNNESDVRVINEEKFLDTIN